MFNGKIYERCDIVQLEADINNFLEILSEDETFELVNVQYTAVPWNGKIAYSCLIIYKCDNYHNGLDIWINKEIQWSIYRSLDFVFTKDRFNKMTFNKLMNNARMLKRSLSSF